MALRGTSGVGWVTGDFGYELSFQPLMIQAPTWLPPAKDVLLPSKARCLTTVVAEPKPIACVLARFANSS